MRFAWSLLAALAACATTPVDDEDGGAGGKDDRGTSDRFVEIDRSHTNATFRGYIHGALDVLREHDSELARLTVSSIAGGQVRIDELADLTCADFLRVSADLPDLSLKPSDHARLKQRGSPLVKAIANEIDGYMWSNRIYVSRGQDALRLAATLVHETNHVVNRSEVGYYDDLPTSAFVHEYRAFHAERLIDPDFYEGIDLVAYVIELYELDRSKIRPDLLASPLTPILLPTSAAWGDRDVTADVEDPADCSP
jgi:hypothetical protein